jgi:hypothetical protein
MIADKKSRLNNKKLTGEPVFVERPVPTEQQVKTFEKAVLKEVRQEEIDDNLSEIYRDKNGNMVDVSHLHKQKDFIFVSVIKKLFVLAVLFCLGYGFYFYFSTQFSNTISVDLAMSAPESAKAGENFNYTVHYKNNSNFDLNSLRLELKYPENFVVEAVTGAGIQAISSSTAQNYFSLPALPINGEVNVVVSGKIITKKDSANLFGASLTYAPGTFSSEFKKEAATSVLVNDLGFDLDYEYANAALVGEDSQVDLLFSNVKDNFLNDFEVSFAFPENITLTNTLESTTTLATSSVNKLIVNKTSSLIWQVGGLVPSSNTYHLPVHYKIIKKVDDNQEIIIRLSKKMDNGKSYIFAEKNIQLNVMNSSLNLTLILNGSKNDNTANFGDTLNYSLVYANKSDTKLNDVVIMAALKSEFLDWSSFMNTQKGIQGENTITWTKEQIPALASLAPGEEGMIDFSIKIRPYDNSDLGKSFTVDSYSQFNINNRQGGLNDSKSNNIITKINSDLKLTEKVLYFDENNVPVGSGPLPPKVNQKTSVKVYWKIENNLHELSGTRVVTKLPDYISFDNKNKVSTGDLSFDSATNSVIWNIGNLPVSTYQAQADFNISVTPTDSQRNSLLVLLSGSTVSAVDSDTGSQIEKKGNSKTSKLEDDDIANLNNSGLVE